MARVRATDRADRADSAERADAGGASPDASTVVIPDRLLFGDPGPRRSQRWLPTLAELLAGELREQILDGDIPDGGKLPKQQQLLEEYQVSAPSLREALRILENERLVTVRRGKVGGAVIHRPTAQSVASIVALVLDARSAPIDEVASLLQRIEPLCVAVCMSSDALEASILQALRENSDGDRFDAAASDEFHRLLVERCGNQTLFLVYEALWSVLANQADTRLVTPAERDTGELAAAAHRRLEELIAGGNVAAAQRFAARHIAECGRFAPSPPPSGRSTRPRAEVSADRLQPGGSSEDGAGGRRPSSRVAEVIADDLRRRILTGELTDGGLLEKQRELADVYNVSFPAVREALRILESEGLLMVRRGSIGGSVVRMPRAGNVAHALALVLQSRRASLQDLVVALQQLEPLCAAACAQRADRLTDVVPSIEEAMEREREVIGDPEEFAAEAMRFHDVLITNCGNTALSLVVGAMQSLWSAQMQALKRISQGLGVITDSAQRREVLAEHEDLSALIAAGDAEAAEQLARGHYFGHSERQPAFTGHGLRVHSSLLRD